MDGVVKRTECLVLDLYGNNETASAFTADHGMSKVVNHSDSGTSDSHRTRT